MKSIHESPKSYSGIERAGALNNMMIERSGLPDGWKVEIPTTKPSHEPVLFGESILTRCGLIEGYMIGLAMASGTISLGKCREWLDAGGARQPHELAMFGMNIRDLFAIEDDQPQPRPRRAKK